MDDPPFGYDVCIELNAGFMRRETIQKHFLGTQSRARRRAMEVPRAVKVLKMEPLTERQWVAAYGDPRLKRKFS